MTKKEIEKLKKDNEILINCIVTIYPTCTNWAKKVILKTRDMIKFPDDFKWPDKNPKWR